MRLAIIVALVALSACDAGIVAEAKTAVADGLRDPESAQFRDVKICPSGKIVRGEVNAKNAFGGYVGFEPFYYIDGDVVFAMEARFSELMAQCFRSGRLGSSEAGNAQAENIVADLEAAADELERAADDVAKEVVR